MPCHFNEGDQANLTITFTPTTPSNQIEIRSTLRTAGLINYEVQVNFDDPMICQNGDSRKDFGKIPCPIVPGETYTFVASRKFPVNTSYNVCLYSTLIILNPVQLIINTWNPLQIFTYSKVRLVNEYGQNVGCADWVLQFNRAEQPITDDESRKWFRILIKIKIN